MTLVFPQNASVGDMPDFTQLPGYVSGVNLAVEAGKTVARIQIIPGAKIRSFRVKGAIILDVTRPLGFQEAAMEEEASSASATASSSDDVENKTTEVIPEGKKPDVIPAKAPEMKKIRPLNDNALVEHQVNHTQENQGNQETRGLQGAQTLAITAHRQLGETPAYLEFHWRTPVGLALFQRDQKFWIVFDKTASFEFPAEKFQKIVGIETSHIHDNEKFLVITGSAKPGLFLTLRHHGNHWIIQFSPTHTLPVKTLSPFVTGDMKKMLVLPLKESLEKPLKENSSVFTMDDKDELYPISFIPLIATNTGVIRPHTMPDARLLLAEQGIAIEHRTPGLNLTPGANSITLSHDEGLTLSPAADRVLSQIASQSKTSAADKQTRLFEWTLPIDATWSRTSRDFLHHLAKLKPEERPAWRMAYARRLLGKCSYKEATAQLELAIEERPGLTQDLRFMGFLAISYILDRAYDKARVLLRGHPFPDEEFSPWRALLLLEGENRPQLAYDLFLSTHEHMNRYPPRIRNLVALKAAECAMRVKKSPKVFLEKLHLKTLTKEQEEKRHFFDALYTLDSKAKHESHFNPTIMLSTGKTQPIVKTLAALNNIMNSADSPAQKAAALSAKKIHLANGYPRIMALEYLLSLYKQTNDLGGTLNTLEDLIIYSDDIVLKKERISQAQQIFRDYFLSKNAHQARPEIQVVFFDHFKRFLPKDDRRIDILLHTAAQFKRMDLIENAMRILQYLLPTLSDKENRSRIMFAMAEFAFEEEKYDQMEFFLRSIHLQEEYREKILFLRIEVLIRKNQYTEAFEMLKNIDQQKSLEMLSKVMLKKKSWYPLLELSKRYAEQNTGKLSPGVLRAVTLFQYYGYEALHGEKNALRGTYNSVREQQGVRVIGIGRVKPGVTNRDKFLQTIQHADNFTKEVKEYLAASDAPIKRSLPAAPIKK